MPVTTATLGLLDQLVGLTAPECEIDEPYMALPDYSVTALVGGLEVARRFGRCATLTATRHAATPSALHWPVTVGARVRCVGLQLGPAPTQPADEQVVAIRDEAELNRLTGVLVERYGDTGTRTNCLFWMLEEAGRNALRWSADHVAYVGWALRRDMLELAIGDSGVGIPLTSGAATSSRSSLEVLVNRFDDRGRCDHGLTRLRQHWRLAVPHVDAYIVSGDELHTFMRYDQSFRSITGAGPTIVAARF